MVEDEDEDTFVTIGTPFQPLEEEDNNRLIHAKERKPGETYRERRERERFHGAFTGGFSAGYYNTVGSKEGKPHANRLNYLKVIKVLSVLALYRMDSLQLCVLSEN